MRFLEYLIVIITQVNKLISLYKRQIYGTNRKNPSNLELSIMADDRRLLYIQRKKKSSECHSNRKPVIDTLVN